MVMLDDESPLLGDWMVLYTHECQQHHGHLRSCPYPLNVSAKQAELSLARIGILPSRASLAYGFLPSLLKFVLDIAL